MSEPAAILIVDDVEENLIALEALLRTERLAIHLARTGRDALELLLAHEFALALIDVHMPEMDGFELAELMRGSERTRDVPIVFVTANYDDPHRVFQGYDAGAVDFLVKPVEPRVLRHKVGTFVELFEQRRRLAVQLADLERVTATLTETLRFHETFVAAVSHDLRGPLSAISMGAEALQLMISDGHAHAVAIRIGSSARRMAAMIDQLYDLARVRLGSGVVLERSTVDLGEVTRELARELEGAPRRVVIEVKVDGDPVGSWDAVRLARVTGNLLANAVQHGTPDTPIVAEIDGRDRDRVRLRVTNGGVIPPELRDSLFEPFRRGHAGTEGLGLGLYIVREVVKAHGGRVSVESSPEHGTTFAIELPRPRS